MQIIGIDVSKAELVGAKVNKNGVVKERFVVKNTREDIETFLAGLRCRNVIGCEATGEYHNELVRACLEKRVQCMVLNPIVTKQYSRATVRKRKTDKTDAEVTACLASHRAKLYHLGFRAGIALPTLARANEKRDWRIYRDLASVLIERARVLYLDEPDIADDTRRSWSMVFVRNY